MVVDDELAIRRLMTKILTKSGYDVVPATDGQEAINLLHSMSVDLIILDMNMPRMDGLSFLKYARDNRLTTAPVLMVTGSTDSDQRMKSYRLGVYDFITKPEQTEVMLKRIENGIKIGEMINFNEFMKVELLMARKLQKYLYPEPTITTDFVSIHTWSLPLSDIGGDLYDFIRFRDDRIIFFVADVSGHSISAALYTAIVKMVFRNAIKETDDPGEVLNFMNSELSGNIPIESFVTMFCGLVDPSEGVIEYSNAGHPRPFIVADNMMGELDGNDSFLGPIADATFRTFRREIRGNESIYVYTDGINDLTDGQQNVVGERLLRSILEGSETGPVEKFDAIKKSVVNSDVVITDDCTLMMLDFVR